MARSFAMGRGEKKLVRKKAQVWHIRSVYMLKCRSRHCANIEPFADREMLRRVNWSVSGQSVRNMMCMCDVEVRER